MNSADTHKPMAHTGQNTVRAHLELFALNGSSPRTFHMCLNSNNWSGIHWGGIFKRKTYREMWYVWLLLLWGVLLLVLVYMMHGTDAPCWLVSTQRDNKHTLKRRHSSLRMITHLCHLPHCLSQ